MGWVLKFLIFDSFFMACGVGIMWGFMCSGLIWLLWIWLSWILAGKSCSPYAHKMFDLLSHPTSCSIFAPCWITHFEHNHMTKSGSSYYTFVYNLIAFDVDKLSPYISASYHPTSWLCVTLCLDIVLHCILTSCHLASKHLVTLASRHHVTSFHALQALRPCLM